MMQYHQLDSYNKVNIKCNNKIIKRVKEHKLLHLILDEDFELQSHVKKILKYGYSTLWILRLLKRYTPFYLQKQLCDFNIIKIRLLQHFVQNITTVSKN